MTRGAEIDVDVGGAAAGRDAQHHLVEPGKRGAVPGEVTESALDGTGAGLRPAVDQASGSGGLGFLAARSPRCSSPIPPPPATADSMPEEAAPGASTCASSWYRHRPRRGCKSRSRVVRIRRPLLRRRLPSGIAVRRRHRRLCHLPSPCRRRFHCRRRCSGWLAALQTGSKWRHPCYPLPGLPRCRQCLVRSA